MIKNKYQKIYSDEDEDEYIMLGTGSFADVFKVTNIEDKNLYLLITID